MVTPKFVTCTDCGKTISVRALACPHCGAPMTPGQPIPVPDIQQIFQSLVRGLPQAANTFVSEVGLTTLLNDTRTNVRVFAVSIDGNSRVRTDDLVARLQELLIDYVVPRSRIAKAVQDAKAEGSAAPILRLQAEAHRLFVQSSDSGEGGEMLAYYFAEHLLRLPQIFCKMPLKTNRNMHVHGTDGVHAYFDSTQAKLLLYFCESKLFAQRRTAVLECLRSLKPYITDSGINGASARDYLLLSTHLDLDNPAIEAVVKAFLDRGREEFNKHEVRGICLAGFDCKHYDPTPKDSSVLGQLVTAELDSWRTHARSKVIAESISGVPIDIILFPMPDVQAFRDRFFQSLGG